MKLKEYKYRFLLSGGGTGGHIFPALAIARALQNEISDCQILFIGAKGKMEIQKIEQAGYKIEGLRIEGLNRKSVIKNIKIPFLFILSIWKCYFIIKKFKPSLIIGTGGYASGPLGFVGNLLNIPLYLQEQNAYPGITNKWLAKKAKKIYIAHEDAKVFFKTEKTLLTGNPIRTEIISKHYDKKEACNKLGIDSKRLLVLSIGGSQGARSINMAWKNNIEQWSQTGYQLLWQTGESDYDSIKKYNLSKNIKVVPFISDMPLAYAAADIIVSRSGALAISELCIVGKPCIFVPFPFAAEDHQTKNALALVERGAALMISDQKIQRELLPEINKVLSDAKLRLRLSRNINLLAKPRATIDIVKDIKKSLQL